MTITVLLADDQPLVRGGFRVLLESAADLDVVGEAADGRQAIDLAEATHPDIVVMDIRMPGVDGLAATKAIIERCPATRVLILTTFEIDEYVLQALRAGASGFLGKGAEPAALVDAVRTIHAGEALLSPAATRSLIARCLALPDGRPATIGLGELTDREREIVALVATGLSNDEIAARLTVSPHTVKTHVNHAMTKIDAHDRAQLVIAAYESGLVRAAAHRG